MSDELTAYLNALPDQLRDHLSGVIREQAELLSDAQRRALQALEESPDETGRLEDSCTVDPGRDDLEFIVQAGGELTSKEIREGSGVSYDYAEGFEFGTSKQPARPFFWPTYRERRAEIQSAIADAVNEVLK